MKLTKKQEEQIQSYLEEQIDVNDLVKNGDVRVGNFIVFYRETSNENYDPEHPDDGDPELWFDVSIINDINDWDTGDHFGTACMTPIYYDKFHDVWLCFNEAMHDFFCDCDWKSDEWSMKTFGF